MINQNYIPTKKYKNKAMWSSLRKAQYDFMKERLSLVQAGGTLLDVGSGASHFSDIYIPYKKTNIDFAPYQDTDVTHDLETGLPFENESYDVVVSTNTFEHIYNSKELIKECYRVTKKGGLLIGSTPFQLCVHQEPHDYYRYTSFALARMMTDAGYIDINVVPLGTHNQLLNQTVDHFFGSIENNVKDKSIIQYYFVRIFWKLNRILLKITLFIFGSTPPSQKHTLGYGFVAKKFK
jgi:SAM-dependent methyltransferase